MAFDLSSIQQNAGATLPRILIYGPEGIGKTTFGAEAPSPIVIPTEDGLGNLDVQNFPLATSYDQVVEACSTLYSEPHDFKTVVVDSLDHLELLIWDKVCQSHEVAAIGDIPYGRGYEEALNYWRNFFQWLTALRDQRQMLIVCTAHATIHRFDAPDRDSYDRYEIKLHKKAKEFVKERFDCVLFATHNPVIRKEDAGFGKKKVKVVNSERVIYTADRPAATAKNRYNLPEMLKLSWGAFADAMAASEGNRAIQQSGGRDLAPEELASESAGKESAPAAASQPPPAPTRQKARA